MPIGLIGKKYGMTRAFTDDGHSIPLTVLRIDEHRVTQIKSFENDGYESIQVTVGTKKTSMLNKPMSGHFAKANVMAGRGLWEFRLTAQEMENYKVGSELSLNVFSEGQMIDVQGISIGKGFAGGVKRHNFRMQDATHGNSRSHRVLGSIGMNQTPGRVFKGKKMEGHLGDVRVTVQNLKIFKIDEKNNLMLIQGSVPGSKGSDVIIKPASKCKIKVS